MKGNNRMNKYYGLSIECSDEHYISRGREDYRLSSQVYQLEELTKEIIKYRGNLFKQLEEEYGTIKVYCEDKSILSKLTKVLSSELWIDYELKREFLNSNPYVNILLDAIESYEIHNINLEESYSVFVHGVDQECYANEHMDTLNEFIDYIRQSGKNKEVKRIVHNFKRNSVNNIESINGLIDQLFQRHGRLLVIRVDLSYKADVNNSYSIAQLYAQAKADREHLLDNIRANRKLFGDAYLGYIWKLEFGFYKKFHYHFVFFFNESKVGRDVNKAMSIGEYWKNVITNGSGVYFNCNAKKNEYQYLGIGAIDYYDGEAIDNLKKAANYLTKADYYVKRIANEGDRIFGRSESDDFSHIPGRPRKYLSYSAPVTHRHVCGE
jgi:hypothetical protein